jgi:hypothetical protein
MFSRQKTNPAAAVGFARLRADRIWLPLLITVVSLVSAGCSDPVARQVAAMNDTNLKKISSLYRFFQYRNGWRGPKGVAELRGFVGQAPRKNLDMMRIDPTRFDELLVSERDGQPAKVRWGVTIGPTDIQPLVFEAEGVGGRRIVVFSDASTEEVDGDRYDTLWSEGGRPVGNAAVQPARPGS